MNTVNQESKSGAIKTLAIIGFIAAVIAGLWITVQVISFIPSAFTSLASLADSLYGQGKTLSFSTEKDVVNSGESLRITYKPVRSDGSYVFSYRCVDGVTAETRNSDGTIVRFDCEQEVTVASGVLTNVDQIAEIMFTSEKGRFSDVPFTLAFIKVDTTKVLYEKNGIVTVVNATIPQTGLVIRDTPTKTVGNPVVAKPATSPVVAKPVTKTPQPVLHKKVPVVVTTYPVSNPNGFTDLEITYLGVGDMRNGIFVPNTVLKTDSPSAFQFAVKNIGTKTSDDWTFSAQFPGSDESSFNSSVQSPLFPSERAVMTIRFTALDRTGTKSLNARAMTSSDVDNGNNSFAKSVQISN